MINSNRVEAIVIRYFLYFRHNLDRLSDMFYWPAMDLLIWGLTGLYLASLGVQQTEYVFVILNGLVFWIIMWRVQYEININILSEIWDKNFVNIFASPLTIWEYLVALMSVGFIKMVISLSFSAILAFALYGYNIISLYGYLLLPIIMNLLLTGWAVGFFIAGFLIRYGARIQSIGWTGIALIAPFSVLYYPLSILPDWAQKIALAVPSTYIFEGMREIIFTGKFSEDKLLISFALNGVYLVLSILFFVFMFRQSRKLGLGRLI